jgi:septal ring factor EnvC (AmiA/AmiB activator)
MAYQNPAGQGAADKNRQRNEMQRNIIMLEADKGKKNVQKMQLDAEIREAKKARERAEMELQARQLKLQKIEQEMATVDVSIKGLKKKLNEL